MQTLEIEHNGFFCGPSSNIEYTSAIVEILDYCNANTFSYSLIENHLKWLGYPVSEHNIYLCRHDHFLSDGMIPIRGDGDVQQMLKYSHYHKVLQIMIDHSNFIQVCRDDVIYKGGTCCSSRVVSVGAVSCNTIAATIEEEPLSDIAADASSGEHIQIEAVEEE